MKVQELKFFIVSDSVGETAELVARAALSQFEFKNYDIRKYSFISEPDQVNEMLEEADQGNTIILFTIVVPAVRQFLMDEINKRGLMAIDLMAGVMEMLEERLCMKPKGEAGLIRKLDEQYFRRIEAIEFAVKYDDGKDPRGLQKADIVLIGISRTSKTPLSMYLAHRNIKVANVPLVPEVSPPRELFDVKSQKIIGLTTDPYKLIEIRKERIKALGLQDNANYASIQRIIEELEYADALMRKLGCPIIDVSARAVEESASIILEICREIGYDVGLMKK
ncbi:MAG: pyruvate, water dikinase regulatory protein [Bacillota bacterium]|nr:pyruvate, water dikinase regulatory protein [Bacillota bacterium]MDW7678656.1 pyruvate, water dikinase regulatory protein [Bacillota bacterium]